MSDKKFVVEGFEFTNEQEVNTAQSELRGINYIVSRTDMNNPKSVLILYNKIIDKKLLKTPIGLKFLKEVQDMLLSSKEIDENLIKPIPTVLDVEITKSELHNKALRNKGKSKYKRLMVNSIIVNVILIIVIIFMFIITGQSNNLNIINYENRIKDQYSSWEEELNQRESSLDQRESSMEIQN